MSDMRLIDANALLKKTRRMYAPDEICSIEPIATACIKTDDVHRAPTIDAVPVVRCRECKHAREFRDGFVACLAWSRAFKRDGFCYMGAKMDLKEEDT